MKYVLRFNFFFQETTELYLWELRGKKHSKEVPKDPGHSAGTNHMGGGRRDGHSCVAQEAIVRKTACILRERDAPYFGTGRKKSVAIRPRKPFSKDEVFNRRFFCTSQGVQAVIGSKQRDGVAIFCF